IVQARQVAMYFAKIKTKDSLTTIGTTIGKRNHATVLHACKTVQDLIDTDKSFRSSIEELNRMFKN
ncbi:MAG: chromosomal replication initiator protein DnaA, partial [Paludibacteraceae bacterium]|nr:chromosomal replication initiator protein DnaA [Paludibacteraceae bacterium]